MTTLNVQQRQQLLIAVTLTVLPLTLFVKTKAVVVDWIVLLVLLLQAVHLMLYARMIVLLISVIVIAQMILTAK